MNLRTTVSHCVPAFLLLPGLRLAVCAIAISGVMLANVCRADSKLSLGQQFIDGHTAVTFSILVPVTEGEKRVENVKVTCDVGKCRVRVASISQRACGGGMTIQGGGFVPYDEVIQVNEYGPELNDTAFRPKVTPGDDAMLIVQYIDAGQDARLRVLLRWEKSLIPGQPFIALGGVVGEEEVVLSRPVRFAHISEIVGSAIICHARFQSR
jgi:hypothetical protein